ncbi:MAG: CbtB domain-containing protein [Alphaproteobacteria bacterium]|nr:CbtB domain-containing protein [Alphaproteobacteria bacterium]
MTGAKVRRCDRIFLFGQKKQEFVMAVQLASTSQVAPAAQLGVKTSALLALVFGLIMLYGVGFAQPQAIHDATHDSRHATAFPCH